MSYYDINDEDLKKRQQNFNASDISFDVLKLDEDEAIAEIGKKFLLCNDPVASLNEWKKEVKALITKAEKKDEVIDYSDYFYDHYKIEGLNLILEDWRLNTKPSKFNPYFFQFHSYSFTAKEILKEIAIWFKNDKSYENISLNDIINDLAAKKEAEIFYK